MVLLKASVWRQAFAFLSIILYLPPAAAQDRSDIKDTDINRLIQELVPVISEETNPEELFEFFFQLLNDPFDINSVTEEQLAGLLFLSDRQIRAFSNYRNRSGRFLSIFELQAIPEWDLTTIHNILPFLTLDAPKTSLRKSLQNPSQHFLVTRTRRILETSRGFSPLDPNSRATTRYAGSPWQWYARYRYARTGAYSVGLTLEKDAGEIFTWAPDRQVFGVDFTSFHVQLLNRGKLKNLIIGDFQIQAGQGLVVGSGFSLGKGSEVIRTTYRSSLGIRPYTSVMEQGYLRGAAVTWRVAKHMDLTAIYGRNRRDGTIGGSGNKFEGEVITSFPTDGYHRTPNERSKHGNILEQNAGFHLHYAPSGTRFQSGLTFLYTNYSLPVEKRELPYNYYEFSGKTNTLAGYHASWHSKNMHWFGEVARSASGGIGAVAGTIAALNRYIDISLLARHYDRDFHTFYGNAFREGSRVINEQGLYTGMKFAPNRKWQYNAYLDLFRFPWKKYLVDTTSSGYGYLFHVLWKPKKSLKAHAVVQREQKQRNNRGDGVPVVPLANVVRSSALINVEWKRSFYTFRTRFQGGKYQFGDEAPDYGLAVAQDASARFRKFEFSGRVALFRTDNYDSRQYLYEKDVLYSFSIPSYYDHGTRHYLLLRYDLWRGMRLWVRWAQTKYTRLESLGSGLDEIAGNKRSEVKMQVMYRF